MACACKNDRWFPGYSTTRAAYSGVRAGFETRHRRRCGHHRTYSCDASAGACDSLDSVGFPWACYLFRAARWGEGEKVPLLQAADDGGGGGRTKREIARRERAQWAVLQDGKRPARDTMRAVAEEGQHR